MNTKIYKPLTSQHDTMQYTLVWKDISYISFLIFLEKKLPLKIE